MGDAFRALEAAKQERLLDNYSLSQTSLEQVFLNIAARQVEDLGAVSAFG